VQKWTKVAIIIGLFCGILPGVLIYYLTREKRVTVAENFVGSNADAYTRALHRLNAENVTAPTYPESWTPEMRELAERTRKGYC
jgi:hypothetical protein